MVSLQNPYRADGVFEWVSSSDSRRPHELARPSDAIYRIAHFTDVHVPSEVEILERLKDLANNHQSVGDWLHNFSAAGNALAHAYHRVREEYSNLLKKTLVGFHLLGVDHVIITGDLAHCGLEAEFMEMRAILEVTGWWGTEKLTVVPGNHDRFNLYERLVREPMEKFFPVVNSREPRIKKLPGGIALLEIESNCDREDDRHFTEQWLPNSYGRIYPETLDFIEKQQADLGEMRLLTCMHHHVSEDWYHFSPEMLFGSLMGPVDNADQFLEAVGLLDPAGAVLHGHKHDLMPVDYAIGPHQISCPGGFAEQLMVNLIDVNPHSELTFTHARLRT